MRTWIVAAVIAGIVLASGAVRAHEGHVHSFRGTLSAINEQNLEITTTDGKVVTFLLDKKTIYRRGKIKIDAKTLKPGERIVVSALEVPEGKTMTAKTVRQ